MINNEISIEKLGAIKNKIPKKYILDVLNFCTLETIKKKLSLCVIIISDIEIKKINKKFRNKNEVTTCLSFPLGLKGFPKNEINVGDIFINIDRIKKHSQDFKKELAFNLIHSFLHLIGFSHSIDKDADKMEKEENRILKGFYESNKKSN